MSTRAALVMLLALVAAIAPAPARAAFPGTNGPMYFERDGDIVRRNVDGTVKNLTANLGQDVYNPAVSKDGMWVAFDDGTWIYTMKRDGTMRRRLDTDLDRCYGGTGAAWSPNGAKIAFVCQGVGTPSYHDVYTMNRDGSGYQRIGQTGSAHMVAWSPNGATLAWTDQQVIYKESANGGTTQVVHNDPPSSPGDPTSGGWMYIDWAPDGGHLIAENLTVGLYEIPAQANANGDERLVLRDGTAVQPVYSPSGTRILFADNTAADPDNDLFTVRLNGTGRLRITNSAGDEASPEWARRT